MHPSSPVRHVQDTPEEFRVSLDAYRGDDLFASEMDKLFHSSWVYVGHESEIARPGDFKSALIGLQPVVLVRTPQNEVQVFLNFCTHRGAALVREPYGSVKSLTCAYHGWSFNLAGELTSVPDQDRYPPSFCPKDRGLIRAAQVEVYGGFIFASLKPTVSLDEHLGEVKKHIDLMLARTAGGKYRLGQPHMYRYQGNWKFQAENVLDGYHPMFTHASALNTFKKLDLLGNRSTDEVMQGGETRGFPQGHGVLRSDPRELVFMPSEEQKPYLERIAKVHGAENVSKIISNQHVLVFPNVAFMDFNVRVIQPIAPGVTEVYSFPLLIDGESEEMNAARLQEVQMRLGTTGMVGADDIDIFARNQTALACKAASHVVLSRGLANEQKLPSGERIGEYSDETPQRAFWRKWSNVMEAAE